MRRVLENWLSVAVGEAGIDVDPALMTAEAVTVLLDLAREAAHGVERPAAPLTTFVAGLALGSGGGLDELRELAARLGERAKEFASD